MLVLGVKLLFKKDAEFTAHSRALDDGIQKAMADVGQDPEKFKADDSVYVKLPGCCVHQIIKTEMKGCYPRKHYYQKINYKIINNFRKDFVFWSLNT